MGWVMERLNGNLKWGVLAGTILALEVIGEESLTHACHRARETAVGKVAIPVALGVTVAHLMDWIPHQYDPYYLVASLTPEKAKNEG